MSGTRVSMLIGVAVAGAMVLTATTRGAVPPFGSAGTGLQLTVGLTSSVTRNGVVVTASAGVARVAPGGLVPLTVTVTSDRDLTAVVRLEAFDPAGRRVLVRSWPGRPLPAGRTPTWTVGWTAAPAVGRYRIAVQVLTSAGQTLLAWNDEAADVIVGAPRDLAPARPVSVGGARSGVPSRRAEA